MRLFDWFSRTPSKDSYARLVRSGIYKAGDQRPIRYDPSAFQLLTEDSPAHLLNLANLYAEYCALPKQSRAQALKKTVRSWFDSQRELPDSFEDASRDLLPNIRSRSYFEETRLELALSGTHELNWPHQVVGDHLMLSLVYDLPGSDSRGLRTPEFAGFCNQ